MSVLDAALRYALAEIAPRDFSPGSGAGLLVTRVPPGRIGERDP